MSIKPWPIVAIALITLALLATGTLKPTSRAAEFTPTIFVHLPIIVKQPPATATSVPPTATSIPPTATKLPPTATATTAAGPCLCYADLYNCDDFSTQAAAQACFNYCQSLGAGDVHHLDNDHDGIACEGLP